MQCGVLELPFGASSKGTQYEARAVSRRACDVTGNVMDSMRHEPGRYVCTHELGRDVCTHVVGVAWRRRAVPRLACDIVGHVVESVRHELGHTVCTNVVGVASRQCN